MESTREALRETVEGVVKAQVGKAHPDLVFDLLNAIEARFKLVDRVERSGIRAPWRPDR